jgi:hypothetical protein
MGNNSKRTRDVFNEPQLMQLFDSLPRMDSFNHSYVLPSFN